MIAELDATVLPLSTTYRCPRAVVREANATVPALCAAPEAPEGTVRRAQRAELESSAAPGDFVLSRTNAPLVSLCYAWLSAGVAARIQGRDIGASLTAWFKRHCRSGASAPDAIERIRKWENSECAKLERDERPTDAITDKADCLRALLEGCDTVAECVAKCARLFADSAPGAAIILSSTHRAKGLEADRVWVLRDTYCQQRRDCNGNVIPVSQEERNLLYVAQTRAMRELVYVNFKES